MSILRKIFAAVLVLFSCSLFSPFAFAQQLVPLRSNQQTTIQRLRATDITLEKRLAANQQNAATSIAPEIPWNMISVVISILAGLAAIFGFSVSSHKKKRAISKYMEEIDSTFSEYKWKTKRCEAELYRLHDVLEDSLKKGKIDESLFELLTKRIDKYLHEIQNLPPGS